MGLDFNAVGAKPEPHSCRSGESISLTAAVGGGAFAWFWGWPDGGGTGPSRWTAVGEVRRGEAAGRGADLPGFSLSTGEASRCHGQGILSQPT